MQIAEATANWVRQEQRRLARRIGRGGVLFGLQVDLIHALDDVATCVEAALLLDGRDAQLQQLKAALASLKVARTLADRCRKEFPTPEPWDFDAKGRFDRLHQIIATLMTRCWHPGIGVREQF